MNQIEFGVFLSPEILNYPELEKRTKYVEEKGYHSIWLSDHLVGVYGNETNPRLESWTALTSLAAKTTKVRLGHLTLAVPFRNPALLAKMASTLDIVSRGRAILSIGAGWHGREFRAYGYKFGTKLIRSDQLGEAAAIIKKMMTEESPTFSGKHYTINDAYNFPKPVQVNGVPLMIAGEGEKRTLRTCALYGDISNYAIWRGNADDFRRKTKILDDHCIKVGRNPDEIVRSWPAFTFINSTDEAAQKDAKTFFTNGGPVGGLIGSPETLIQNIYNFIDAGAQLFILSFLGSDWKAEVDNFIDEVVPEFT
jgi:alkanesulfonate monooxygenase SsuD/methylene tetrahydromethanopterin reductase-like flavin-dependent oxidoreductase (luciferase family)